MDFDTNGNASSSEVFDVFDNFIDNINDRY